MLGIILIKCCHHSSKKKDSLMSLQVSTQHNKMEWQNEKMAMLQLSPEPFFSKNNIPKNYCGEIVLTATHLINRLLTRLLDYNSPREVFSKFFLDLRTINHLVPKVFRCVSFIHIHQNNQVKLDPRAFKCVFIGYSSTQKGYKCYHPPTKRICLYRCNIR